MRFVIVFLICTVLFPIFVFAQPPDTLWTRTYNEGYSAWGYSVKQTVDGGFIVCGCTRPFSASFNDLHLVKTDNMGDTIWTRTYGGNLTERGFEVHQTYDGGYIAAGYSTPFVYWIDAYLVKTDESGDTTWTRTYRMGYPSQALSVYPASDGGYIMTGNISIPHNTDHLILIRTDSEGNELWARILWDYWGMGESIIQDDEGNIVVAGRVINPGDEYTDLFIMKADMNGDTLWTRTYGGVYIDVAAQIQQTDDGGYIIAGSHYPSMQNPDFYLIKTDSEGDTFWTRTYGDEAHNCAYSVDQTSDGGYILAGRRYFAISESDCEIVRTDANGDTLWTERMGGYEHDEAWSVQQTFDGGFIVCGTSDSFNPGNDAEVWLIRFDAESNLVEDFSAHYPMEFTLHQNHPNPFNPATTISCDLPKAGDITLMIYDIQGREVIRLVDGWHPAGRYEEIWHARGMPSGIYFARLQAEGFSQMRKMLLVK